MTSRAYRASLTIGSLLYVGGAPLLLFVFVMSAMSGRYLEAGTSEWWAAVLGTMFRRGDAGPVTLVLLVESVVGVILIGRGLWGTFGRLRFTTRRLMAAVLVVAFGLVHVPLGVLMALPAPVVLALLALRRRPALASGRGPGDGRP